MFCLGCGVEMPLRAACCPVCGRGNASRADSSEAMRDTSPGMSIATYTSASPQTGMYAQPAASNVPDASATGLPRDTAGHILPFVAVALAADLFAPWSIVYGQQKTMAAHGAEAFAFLALFALAVLPLMRPGFRARAHVAVAPLAVGAFCLGAGIFYWVMLNRENAFDLAQAQLTQPGWSNNGSAPTGGVMSSPPPVVVPGFGLYLFLIGSAVLAVVGYQLFLQAALASAHATVAHTAQPASPLPSIAPTSASMPLATSISPVTRMATPAVVSSPLAAASASEPLPHLPSAPSTASIPARPATTAAKAVVLPGSAAWNEAPKLPAFIRPSRGGRGGWSRQAGVRR